MRKLQNVTISIVLLISLLLAGSSINVLARQLLATEPPLGTAAAASILATTGVTNSGTSSTNRDVDVFPGPSCIIPVGLTIGGAAHFCDGVAAGVLADTTSAALNLEGQPSTSNQGPALDGLTLVPGVYDIGAGRLNGGVLTLDGPGIYIFRSSSDFVSSGSVSLINGARACDVYWRVQSLTTINGSSFVGTIIAGTGIHFGDSVTLDGRALVINGDVTLINNTITGPSCALPAATEEATAVTRSRKTPAPSVSGLPNTGGAPIRSQEFPWSIVIVTGLSTAALIIGLRAYRRGRLPRQ